MMKKLLFTCDGNHFSHSLFAFAASINKQEKIWLKGVFLPSMDYSRLPAFAYVNSYEGFLPPDFYEQEEKLMDQSIKQFEDLCQEHQISHSTYKHTGFDALQGLLDETRFADGVLVQSKNFFSAMDGGQPNAELNQLLHSTECPVFLIPEMFEEPKNIIFAYDGERSCMAAIKHLGMVMKNYKKLPLTIISFSVPSGERPPYEKLIAEYIGCHYKKFIIKVVDSDGADYLDHWLAEYPSPLIITGSYSRSGLSRTFKKSFISTELNDQKFPIFLFHRKG
jgi:hypothetical protein